jgi:carboxymethylenebutenolidase
MAFAMTPLVSRLPQGFAAAVLPITTSTITTDTNGLVAGEVEVPAGDISVPAYRAKPASGTAFPTVLVIQEIFGIHEHIKDLCRRLAKDGYFAVAPYLYERQGQVAGMSDVQELYTKVVSHVPDSQVMSDLDATAAWAATEGADTKRLFAAGWCWGGRAVWLYAAHSSQLKAGAAWYGRLGPGPTGKQPKTPIDVAKDLKAPVIGLYGGQDAGIPLGQVEQLRGALAAAGKPDNIHIYPNSQHGFNADYRPAYDPAAAKDAWAKMLAFFKAQM